MPAHPPVPAHSKIPDILPVPAALHLSQPADLPAALLRLPLPAHPNTLDMPDRPVPGRLLEPVPAHPPVPELQAVPDKLHLLQPGPEPPALPRSHRDKPALLPPALPPAAQGNQATPDPVLPALLQESQQLHNMYHNLHSKHLYIHKNHRQAQPSSSHPRTVLPQAHLSCTPYRSAQNPHLPPHVLPMLPDIPLLHCKQPLVQLPLPVRL